jgi:plasmid stabilization system protein ParE
VILEWSAAALADLERFAAFLESHYPDLAPRIAVEIKAKAALIEERPRIGRPLAGRAEYRQVVLGVLNAAYVFQYRFFEGRLVMLRVFHSRENRE